MGAGARQATAASSPLNYARNLLYAPVPPGGRARAGGLGLRLVGELFAEAAKQVWAGGRRERERERERESRRTDGRTEKGCGWVGVGGWV